MEAAPSRAKSCVECGRPLALFQPVCEDCGTTHKWTYQAPCHDCGEVVSYTDGDCPHCGATLLIWRALEADALAGEEQLTIWKEAVPRPTEAGYRIHFGSIHGQWADYRRSLGEDGDLHIRSYSKRYELHHDDVSAVDAPGRHLLRHGPPAATASGIDLAKRVGRTVGESARLATWTVYSPYVWLADRQRPKDTE